MLWDSRKLLSPRSPQERKGRIIEEIQYSCRYACENEGYIPSFSNEMLNRGGDFNHFIPIGVLYLIYSNEHTTAAKRGGRLSKNRAKRLPLRFSSHCGMSFHDA